MRDFELAMKAVSDATRTRILKLLARRDIPATFFIPGHTIETYPDVCRQIADAGHEITLAGRLRKGAAGQQRQAQHDHEPVLTTKQARRLPAAMMFVPSTIDAS